MLTVLMKWISAAASAALLVSLTLPNFGFALALVVFGGASGVVFQAARTQKYLWARCLRACHIGLSPGGAGGPLLRNVAVVIRHIHGVLHFLDAPGGRFHI